LTELLLNNTINFIDFRNTLDSFFSCIQSDMRKESMKKYFIIFGIILIAISSCCIYYFQTHISIWGFTIPKSELGDVLINTKEHGYMITSSELVMDLTIEVSKMKKLYKINPIEFPISEVCTKYSEILIQTKDHTTYGGSCWVYNNEIILNSNGYYWAVSPKLFNLIDKSIIGSRKMF